MDISPNDKDILGQFRKGAYDALPNKEQKALWQRIEQTVRKPRAKHISFPRLYKCVAAAACLVILAGVGYWLNNKETTMSKMVVIETQARQRQQVILPDSSVVWLNAGSRLEYPEKFTDHRHVRLEGEAYFDVAHDSVHPFKVSVSGLDVTVQGTVFNVAAYDDTEIVTTLVEGKVAIQLEDDQSQQTTLTPNQQATFYKDTKSLTFATVNTELFTSWVSGYYRFEDTSFEQIARQLGRMYGVKIVFANEFLKSLSYTGTFLQEQDINTVLDLLRDIRDFHYDIQGNQIIINQ